MRISDWSSDVCSSDLDGRVALNGWAKVTGHDVIETAVHCERDGVEAIIYTDIARDGMMQGFNAESTSALAKALKTPVLASGGVRSAERRVGTRCVRTCRSRWLANE